jgi:hypothetical protein
LDEKPLGRVRYHLNKNGRFTKRSTHVHKTRWWWSSVMQKIAEDMLGADRRMNTFHTYLVNNVGTEWKAWYTGYIIGKEWTLHGLTEE